MKAEINIKELLKRGEIQNELELERALLADRKLRVLAKDDPKYKVLRKELRDLIEVYENKHWSENSNISTAQVRESAIAEYIVEQERQFIWNRKARIKKELKRLSLTQQELGVILGHGSKSYISELMNGVSPFTLRDLIVINKLFKIDLEDLVPAFISETDQINIISTIKTLENPKLKLSKEDFCLV